MSLLFQIYGFQRYLNIESPFIYINNANSQLFSITLQKPHSINDHKIIQKLLIISKNIELQSMAKNQLDEQLFNLTKALIKSMLLIYRIYSPYIKSLLLIIISYMAFRVGRLTVADRLEEQVNKMKETLNSREKYSIRLPQRINVISKIKIGLFVALVIGVIAVPLMYNFRIKIMRKIGLQKILLTGAGVLVSVISLWLFQGFLNYQLKKGKQGDHLINQKLYNIGKLLGARAEGFLRIFMCRQKMKDYKPHPYGICYKQKCKQHRKLLKEKQEGVQFLVTSALNFQWCTICRRKIPFDQFLSFSSEQFQNRLEQGEEEEVNRKNAFMLHQLQRMIKWVREVCPCNCSKLYWALSIKYINMFKQREKDVDQRLTFHLLRR